jgi:hypothetical protein
MKLSVEQIENIKLKHPDFDFAKFVEWHQAIQEELRKASPVEPSRKGCEL